MFGRKYYGVVRWQFVADERGTIVAVRYGVSPGASLAAALRALDG
jgi:peroxiredoxin